MWPFKKKHPKPPSAADLTRAEVAWLENQRDTLTTLARDAHLPIAPPLETADALLRWWHKQPEATRIDPNIIVMAIGVALGDALAKACRLEWKIITDPFGTDMGLWGGDRGIILSPTHTAAKKLAESPEGFVVALVPRMVAQVAEIEAQLQSPPK
jgi:hypothetical protein